MQDAGRKPILKIFVSATSGDLRLVRETVNKAIQALGCVAEEQGTFAPDFRTVTDSLREKIKGCDAVIHIVGRRFGAEPSVASLPPGAPRRSYTQLEYFMARELGKKIFVILCGDDFPYDPCESEDPEKAALQANHYTRLAAADDEYRVVSTGEACYSYVLQLQVQFEELAKQLARVHRTHRLLLTAIAMSLTALLALGAVQLAGIRRQERESKRMADAVVDSSQRTASGIDGLSDTVDRVIHNQTAVEICKRAGVDWIEVEQLCLQAKAAGTGVLDFASQLHEKGRYRESIDLSRFLAECALLGDPPDHRSAALAFHTALRCEWSRDDLGRDHREVVADRLRTLEALASRGVEAAVSASPADTALDPTVVCDLLYFRARALLRLSSIQAWGDASPRKLAAVARQLESSVERRDLPNSIAARLSRVEAGCLRELAATQRAPDEQESLRKAVQCAQDACERSDEASDKAESLLTQADVLLLLADTLAGSEARDALEGAASACEACLMLDTTSDKGDFRFRARILRSQVFLSLADEVPERESADATERAINELKAIISETTEYSLADVRHQAAIALLQSGGLDDGECDGVLRIADERSSWWRVRDAITWADIATGFAWRFGVGREAKATALEDAIKLLDALSSFGVRDRPRECGFVDLYRAKCLYSRSMNPDELFPRRDQKAALELFAGLIRRYPVASYRSIHIPAVMYSIHLQMASGIVTPGELRHIREEITKELQNGMESVHRAEVDEFFGDRFRDVKSYELAAECYEQALRVYTEDSWPKKRKRIEDRYDECRQKIGAKR